MKWLTLAMFLVPPQADEPEKEEGTLEDIENTNTVRYVMKNGELYEAATLDQIWPEKKRLPDQYWWGDMPEPTTIEGGNE